jgi:putative ATPase
VAVSAAQVVALVGMPEAELALAQAVLYLATAPKSNRVTTAYEAARQDVREQANPPVPLHLRNAPTRLMRELGRGAGYLYPHDFERGLVAQEYLPEGLRGRIYYTPTAEGYERTLAERLEAWRAFRDSLRRAGQVGRPLQGREESQASPRREISQGETSDPQPGS